MRGGGNHKHTIPEPMPSSHRRRRAHLRLGQIHPRQQPRSPSHAQARHGRNADPGFQHPWSASAIPNGSGSCSIAEASWRQDKRLTARLRVAKSRQQAGVEDVDYRSPRGLDRALFQKLAEGEGINAHENLASTGVGKSWLAPVLGHKACRDNRSVLHQAGVPGSSRTSPWRAATTAIRVSGRAAMIFWKSSKNATDAAPRSMWK
jgi:hypothetical protein